MRCLSKGRRGPPTDPGHRCLFVSKRRKSGLADLIDVDNDIVTAAITVAELRTDIGLANDTHRSGRTELLVQV